MNISDEIKKLRKQITDLWGTITGLQDGVETGIAHDLLSILHEDTDPDSPVEGDIIIADATPEWARLARGTNGEFLKLVSGLPSWESIGHDLLSAVHPDTDPDNVERGDLIVGQESAPIWARLPVGDAAQVLTTDGTDVYWDDPSAGGGGSFVDNFDDASRHWGWYDHNTDANRTIVESGTILTITSSGVTSDWWSAVNSAPKCITGFPGFPCEIICKLNSFTVNDKVIGGLFVASDALGTSADMAVYFGRGRDDGAGRNGLLIESLGTWRYYVAVTTLPIWLKILATGDTGGMKLSFFYSTDGISYTDTTYVFTSIARAAGGVAGLFAKNWTGNAIAAPFEFFTMTVSSGPG